MRPKGVDVLDRLISDLSALRNHLVMSNAEIDESGMMAQVGPLIERWASSAAGGGAPASSGSSSAAGSTKCPHCNGAIKVTIGK